MNKNAKKWVEALESGKFKQARQQLRCQTKTGKTIRTSYCCLGVACVIYQRETDDPVPEVITESALPPRVASWLGLSSTLGGFKSTGYGRDLAELNDNENLSFKKIAAFIKSEPEGLFK